MSEFEAEPAGEPDSPPSADDALGEVRDAAGAVVASLKWLVEATERVIEDPAAFAVVVESGKSVVDAFIGGFASQATDGEPAAESGAEPTAEGDGLDQES